MATGWPMKTTYANGDVYSASDVNDITGTINLLGSSVAYTAGKNKIINGAFNLWQRGTSFTNPAGGAYVADRFVMDYSTSTVNCVVSQQSFTPGTAPVLGYESQYYLRISQSAATATNAIYFQQRIEDVRTFAGQTVTVSFWAKANASKTITSRFLQRFGSGGSSVVVVAGIANSITTSWARYTNTISIPSISGKTVGTGSYLELGLSYDSNAIQDIDFWGVQVEAGSTATAFQTASGSIGGELALCQRYYQKSYAQGTTVPTNSTLVGVQACTSANAAAAAFYGYQYLPVVMRIAPTVTIYSYTSSTAGAVSNGNGTDLAASSGLAGGIADRGYYIYNGSAGSITATSGGYLFHYQASAEL